MIVQDKVRARAYLQSLLHAGYKPHSVFVLSDKNESEDSLEKTVNEMDYFNPAETLLQTIQKENIPYKIIPAEGFNEPQVIAALTQAEGEYYIFSDLKGSFL